MKLTFIIIVLINATYASKEAKEHWKKYNDCLVTYHNTHKRLNGVIEKYFMALEGHSISFACQLCNRPNMTDNIKWWFQKDISHKRINSKRVKSAVIEKNGEMNIYHVEKAHSGIYYCSVGFSMGDPIVLETCTTEDNTTKITYQDNAIKINATGNETHVNNAFSYYIKWSDWTLCNLCDEEGIQVKIGICTIKIDDRQKDYKYELPCKSKRAPSLIRFDENIVNQIMITKCKENCLIVEKAGRGNITKYIHNNFTTPIPNNIFLNVEIGETVKIFCPGNKMNNAMVVWKIGVDETQHFYKNIDDKISVKLNGEIVIKDINNTDANIYSCWFRKELMGIVHVNISEPYTLHFNDYLAMFATIAIFWTFLRCFYKIGRIRRL